MTSRFRQLMIGSMVGLTLTAGLTLPFAAPVVANSCSANIGQTCNETDVPGAGNSVTATVVTNDQATGLGHYCLNPYYSSTGTIVLQAQSFLSGTQSPQDIIFRLWFSYPDDPTMVNRQRILFDGAMHLDASSVNRYMQGPPPPDGSTVTTPGYFQACFQNYELPAVNVDITMAVQQAD